MLYCGEIFGERDKKKKMRLALSILVSVLDDGKQWKNLYENFSGKTVIQKFILTCFAHKDKNIL